MNIKEFILKVAKTKTLMFFVFLLSFFVYFASASEFQIEAPSTIYKGCVQPYMVKMDTNGIATKSIDVKFFLTGYFDFDNSYTDFDSAIASGDVYANYINGETFSNLFTHTGVANSGGAYQGWDYLYLNGYQDFNAADISGDNLTIATLYLGANDFDTGYLDFYFVNDRNGDDSNISSGINNGTMYVDSLSGITNLNQAFSSDFDCESKPYISEAQYRQTGYVSTNDGVQAVWTSVVAGPLYSGDTTRTVWTKGGIELLLTGVSDAYANDGGLMQDNLSTGIKINDTLVSALNDEYISRIDGNTGWAHQYYEVLVTGNVTTGFVGFENILGNAGSTYDTGGNKYNDEFNIDVFWIDTVVPTTDGYFTGYISASGGITTTYTLSGENYDGAVSNPTNGFHADWTYMDDQYKVIGFSGTNPINANCTELGYACTETGYMDYLSTDVDGYVKSGSNIFKLEHDIVFTNSFSGIVIVSDRAGNTGEWAIDINMDDEIVVGYGLIAYTEGAGYRNTTNLSGMLLKLAIYSGGFDKNQLLGSDGINELVYTGWVKTSSTGYAAFTGNFASGNYWVLAEGVNTLSYMISGVNLNQIGGLIDFGNDYPEGFSLGDVNVTASTSGVVYSVYESSASRNQDVGATDLANLILVWAKWHNIGDSGYEGLNPGVGVYTGQLFVDIPVDLGNLDLNKIMLYDDLQSAENRELYMQYHPFDLDADGVVGYSDYAIIDANFSKTGFTNGGRLDGAIPATMPF